jgi:hypothetical protein
MISVIRNTDGLKSRGGRNDLGKARVWFIPWGLMRRAVVCGREQRLIDTLFSYISDHPMYNVLFMDRIRTWRALEIR